MRSLSLGKAMLSKHLLAVRATGSPTPKPDDCFINVTLTCHSFLLYHLDLRNGGKDNKRKKGREQAHGTPYMARHTRHVGHGCLHAFATVGSIVHAGAWHGRT